MEVAQPTFFNTDAQLIIDEMVSYYENLVGFKLSPGQAEMLLINAFAYREHLLRIQGNEVAKQNLLAFSSYPMIDYLGDLLGVYRLPAASAQCTIRFYLESGHPAIALPEGIQVQSLDGKVIFKTLESKSVSIGVSSVDVKAECTTAGATGNGYNVGEISIILDPQAYVRAATNLANTNGGADDEKDDALRERIRLAPSSFSTAGPDDAYIYFAKSAHPSIIDVGIKSLIPGTVNVYPLLLNAETPTTEILEAIEAKLNPTKTRPLNDKVVVSAPTKLEYEVIANVVLLTGALTDPVKSQIEKNVNDYVALRKAKLGRDAVRTQLIAKINIDDVYEVDLVEPSSDVEADKNEVAYCTGVTINIIGYSDE